MFSIAYRAWVLEITQDNSGMAEWFRGALLPVFHDRALLQITHMQLYVFEGREPVC